MLSLVHIIFTVESKFCGTVRRCMDIVQSVVFALITKTNINRHNRMTIQKKAIIGQHICCVTNYLNLTSCNAENMPKVFYVRLTITSWIVRTITKLSAPFIFILLNHHISTCSDISAAHHHEVECIYVANCTCYIVQLTVSRPGPLTDNPAVYQVPFATYIHSTSWLWAADISEHVEVWWFNKLRINGPSSWLLYVYMPKG
jgi:hypothetical protein